jgi:hypothetical protein
MSSALHETGLPPWLFTPRMAVAGGVAFAFLALLVGNVVGFIGGLYDRTDLNSAPACFAISRSIAAGSEPFSRSSHDAKRIAGERKNDVAKVQAAAVDCKPASCDKAARERYRVATREYLMNRSRAASISFAKYGEAGLVYARWVYDAEEDRQIIDGLRQRYGARLFDLETMDNGGHDYIAATRMLLFGKVNDFKPCARAG